MNNTLRRMPITQSQVSGVSQSTDMIGKVHPLLVTPIRFIPFDTQRWLMEKLIKSTFAAAMADGDLDFLYDRWLKIEVADLKLVWYLTMESAGPRVSTGPIEHHGVIRGNLTAFVSLFNQQELTSHLFLKRRLMVRGDRDMGMSVKGILCHAKLTGLPQKAALVAQKWIELLEIEDKSVLRG